MVADNPLFTDKLFVVELSTMAVVYAPDETAAKQIAKNRILDIVTECPITVGFTKEVVDAASLPDGWNDWCYPYNSLYTTTQMIGDILNRQKPEPAATAELSAMSDAVAEAISALLEVQRLARIEAAKLG
jgi:hypothetical protein